MVLRLREQGQVITAMSKPYTNDNVEEYLMMMMIHDIIAVSPTTAWGWWDKQNRGHLLETVIKLQSNEQTSITNTSKKKESI